MGGSGRLRHPYAARLRRLFANPLGTCLRDVLCTTIGLQELLLAEACVPSHSGPDSRKRTFHRGRAKPHGAATSQTSFGHTVCHRLDTTVHHQASWTPPRVQEFLLYGPLFCVGTYEQSGSLSEVRSFGPVLAKGFGFGSHVGYYSRTRLTLTRCLRGAYGRLMLNAPWLSSIFVRFMFLVNTADLLDQICPHIKCELQNDKDTKKLTRRKKLTQPCALQCFPYAPSSYDKNLTRYKQVGLWHGSSLF